MKRILLIFGVLAVVAVTSAQVFIRQGSLGESFNCTMISTATSLTEVTGCAATAGKSYYITNIAWSSSIISTTTNYMLIQSGTGTNCGSNTTSLYSGFIAAAFTSVSVPMITPIKATVAHAICFVHPGAGTRNVNIQGFLR